MSADEYGSFAGDYHGLFDDVALRLGSDVPGVRAALASLAPGSRVLDAACGLGIDAAWLCRHGHSVAAADASAAMVDAARSRLATNDGIAEIDVVTCDWDQLDEHFTPASFDMVLCIGSAIAHTSDAPAMVSALGAFRSMLRPGGVVVVDSHDWEVVIATGNSSTVDPVVVERDGTRCIRTYTWHLPERPGAPAIFEPAVIFHNEERAEMRSHPIRLWPYTRRQLKDRLSQAGFEAVQLDRMPGDDRYTAVARAPVRPAATARHIGG